MSTLMKIDTSGLEELLVKLYTAEKSNSKAVVEKVLKKVSRQVAKDTEDALAPSNLPAGGIYSRGDTADSIAKDEQPEWEGMVGSIGIGFDFNKPGAGGYLITGTPRMDPVRKLNQMYRGKAYSRKLMKSIEDEIFEDIIGAELKK